MHHSSRPSGVPMLRWRLTVALAAFCPQVKFTVLEQSRAHSTVELQLVCPEGSTAIMQFRASGADKSQVKQVRCCRPFWPVHGVEAALQAGARAAANAWLLECRAKEGETLQRTYASLGALKDPEWCCK